MGDTVSSAKELNEGVKAKETALDEEIKKVEEERKALTGVSEEMEKMRFTMHRTEVNCSNHRRENYWLREEMRSLKRRLEAIERNDRKIEEEKVKRQKVEREIKERVRIEEKEREDKN